MCDSKDYLTISRWEKSENKYSTELALASGVTRHLRVWERKGRGGEATELERSGACMLPQKFVQIAGPYPSILLVRLQPNHFHPYAWLAWCHQL